MLSVFILVLTVSTFDTRSGVSISDVGYPFASKQECEVAGATAIKSIAGPLTTARFVCLESTVKR